MNVPALHINGKRWIDCPEPVSYAAADYATTEGYKPGSREWWNAFRWFKRKHYAEEGASEADARDADILEQRGEGGE